MAPEAFAIAASLLSRNSRIAASGAQMGRYSRRPARSLALALFQSSGVQMLETTSIRKRYRCSAAGGSQHVVGVSYRRSHKQQWSLTALNARYRLRVSALEFASACEANWSSVRGSERLFRLLTNCCRRYGSGQFASASTRRYTLTDIQYASGTTFHAAQGVGRSPLAIIPAPHTSDWWQA